MDPPKLDPNSTNFKMKVGRNVSVERRMERNVSVNGSLAAHRRSKSAPRRSAISTNTKFGNKNKSLDYVEQFCFNMAEKTAREKDNGIDFGEKPQGGSRTVKRETVITSDNSEYRVKNNKYIARVEKPVIIPLAALQMVGQNQSAASKRCTGRFL